MARLIDADALKRDIKNRCVLSPLDAPKPLAYGDTDLIEIIDATPTAEPKHGRWIKHNHYVECSLCHSRWNSDYNDTYAFSYCPHCGARMDGGEE